MDRIIHRLEALTVHMAEQLDSTEYEEIEQFVDLREEMINELKAAPLSPAERLQFKLIYTDKLEPLNRAILQKMMMLKREAEEGMAKVRTANAHRNAYDQAYGNESILFDSRK